MFMNCAVTFLPFLTPSLNSLHFSSFFLFNPFSSLYITLFTFSVISRSLCSFRLPGSLSFSLSLSSAFYWSPRITPPPPSRPLPSLIRFSSSFIMFSSHVNIPMNSQMMHVLFSRYRANVKNSRATKWWSLTENRPQYGNNGSLCSYSRGSIRQSHFPWRNFTSLTWENTRIATIL